MIIEKIKKKIQQKTTSTVSKSFNVFSFWKFILHINFIFYEERRTCQIIILEK